MPDGWRNVPVMLKERRDAIAIDDTYGKAGDGPSVFVTEDRRTHVAVVFPDDQVDEIRGHMRGLLADVSEVLGMPVDELHFTDIYTRRGLWRPRQICGLLAEWQPALDVGLHCARDRSAGMGTVSWRALANSTRKPPGRASALSGPSRADQEAAD